MAGLAGSEQEQTSVTISRFEQNGMDLHIIVYVCVQQ